MKKIYTFCIFTFLFPFNYKVTAQTTLFTGDIAFSGYNATPNSPALDAFSFVLLKNCSAGTVINFTDNAWGNDNLFRSGETTVTFTLGTAKVAGTEITIAGPPAGSATATFVGGASAGTCVGTTLSLSVNGDQVIAYQGSVSSPVFLSAIHMNVYNGSPDITVTQTTNWDNVAVASQTNFSSYIPIGLTTATNAIWIGTQGSISSERNNARFSETLANAGGANLTTVAGVRTALNNQAFWNSELAASGATPSWLLPSGANFLGTVVPIKLLNFNAKLNGNNALIQWQVAYEINFGKYEIEKSLDGLAFTKIGTVQSALNSTTNTLYSYNDNGLSQLSLNFIYYRLKMIDGNDDVTYSNIAKIAIKKSEMLQFVQLANPTKQLNDFNIYAGIATNAAIQILDLDGKIRFKKSIQLNVGENRINFSPNVFLTRGIYIIKLESSVYSINQKIIID